MSTPPPIPANLLQKRSINNRQVLYFNNREAYLAGIYPGIPDLDGVNGDTSSIANGTVDYRPKMEFLAKNGNNFFRHWVIFYPLFIDPTKFPPPDDDDPCRETSESVTSAGESWRQRYSPFSYNRSHKKWDLKVYNEEFFRKLRLMIKTANEYGIIVQLTLFDRCGLDFVKDKCKRWPYSPWNAKNNFHNLIKIAPPENRGVNEFYMRDIAGGGTTLGALQDAYVDKVVASTLEFPNVVYEIMNEPGHTFGDARNPLKRARWADTIVGVIYGRTQGKRFIFYNDHTNLPNWPQRGEDIIRWAESNNGTSNFAKLDGVIFHGDVKAVNPGQLNPTLRKNLIIQVSTDTFTGGNREYHRLTTTNAFTNHMMFQAEAAHDETVADDENAAAGIGSAVPAPTLFKLPPFIATWVKTGETAPPTGVPHACYTQNADASMVSINPDTDRLIQQGRVIQLYTNRIAFWNETLQRVGVQEFTFTNNSQNLTLKRANGGTQTFKKYAGPLRPFLYQWERISDTAPSPTAPFFAFFYPDGALRTRNISDFEVTNHARVTFDTPQSNQIRIKSDTFQTDVVWNYSFSADGRELTIQRVVADPPQVVTRVFRRVV